MSCLDVSQVDPYPESQTLLSEKQIKASEPTTLNIRLPQSALLPDQAVLLLNAIVNLWNMIKNYITITLIIIILQAYNSHLRM